MSHLFITHDVKRKRNSEKDTHGTLINLMNNGANKFAKQEKKHCHL